MRRRPGGPRHAQDAAAPQIERWALARGAGPSVARWGDGRSGWAGGEGVRGWNDRPQSVKWRETRGAALSAALACTLEPLDFWARWLETSANSVLCGFLLATVSALFPSVLRHKVSARRHRGEPNRGTGPRRPKNRQAAEAHPRACCLLSGWSVHGATRGAASLRANDQLPCNPTVELEASASSYSDSSNSPYANHAPLRTFSQQPT